MAERLTLDGGQYETETDDGETIEKNRFWIDVSNSLMNRLTAVSMETGDDPRSILSEAIAGERALSDDESDEESD